MTDPVMQNLKDLWVQTCANVYNDHAAKEAESNDDEPTCPSCTGPMYTQAHWHYWQCDDCGRRDDKEEMEP